MRPSNRIILSVIAVLIGSTGAPALAGQPGAAREPGLHALVTGLAKITDHKTATAMKQVYREHFGRPVYVSKWSTQEWGLFQRSRDTALIAINRQVAREPGERPPSAATLLKQIKAEHQATDRQSHIRVGAPVITTALREPHGWLLDPAELGGRTANLPGRLLNAAPGHGGDVWFVEHGSGHVAAYSTSELKAANASGKPSLWLGH